VEAREELVVHVTIAQRDGVGVLERQLLGIGEQRARPVLVELTDLLGGTPGPLPTAR
jgi:hypothetical protein